MNSVGEIIEAFGGPTKFSAALGFKHVSTASEMQRRGSIPSKYFSKIVDEARLRGIRGVTFKSLALLHSEKAA
jgi:hypothetical protein